ncbi:MAG: YjgP/YjgQ family permease [Chlorobi bacterium]|nr:YjgP/YjgQ family permease [Chlorobiota bacterium]
MIKKIDKYILKQYFGTFLGLFLLFIPISILIDLGERLEKFAENKVPLSEVLEYYKAFILTYFNVLFPIFLFLSIIWFTSRMAQNTEIIAILNGGMSFKRFLLPYLAGAVVVSGIVIWMNTGIIPRARMTYNEFWAKYFNKHGQFREKNDVYRQLDSTRYVYAGSINHKADMAYEFILEKIEGGRLTYRLYGSRLKRKADTSYEYHLSNVVIRRFLPDGRQIVEKRAAMDTVMPFTFDDLTPLNYVAEGLSNRELKKFIEKEKLRGSANIDRYLLEKYKRVSLPVSALILTFIAVAVASRKRRGGIGMNLALGMVIAFTYIFFDKIFGILTVKSGFNPFLAAWIPNLIFFILALYLLRHAQR